MEKPDCWMWLDVAKGITEHDNQHVFKEGCEDVFFPEALRKT